MCTLAFSWNPGSDQPFVLASNRDEFYARRAAVSSWWEDAPHVLAGRDLESQGTWLGVSRTGRIAFLTNHRSAAERHPYARSRGHLVADYLRGQEPGPHYLTQLLPRLGRYNGFNLVVGQLTDTSEQAAGLWVLESRSNRGVREVTPGVHGLSNALLDAPWPKLTRLTGAVAVLSARRAAPSDYLAALSDNTRAIDAELPQTGVSLEWERLLSSVFIRSPRYGTRAQTVVRASDGGDVQWIERSFEQPDLAPIEVKHQFRIGCDTDATPPRYVSGFAASEGAQASE